MGNDLKSAGEIAREMGRPEGCSRGWIRPTCGLPL